MRVRLQCVTLMRILWIRTGFTDRKNGGCFYGKTISLGDHACM